MNENEFWLGVWLLCAIVIASIAGAIAWASVKNAPIHHESMQECVKAGGSWQNNDCFLTPRRIQ